MNRFLVVLLGISIQVLARCGATDLEQDMVDTSCDEAPIVGTWTGSAILDGLERKFTIGIRALQSCEMRMGLTTPLPIELDVNTEWTNEEHHIDGIGGSYFGSSARLTAGPTGRETFSALEGVLAAQSIVGTIVAFNDTTTIALILQGPG